MVGDRTLNKNQWVSQENMNEHFNGIFRENMTLLLKSSSAQKKIVGFYILRLKEYTKCNELLCKAYSTIVCLFALLLDFIYSHDMQGQYILLEE